MEYSKCIFTEGRSNEYRDSKQHYLTLRKHYVMNMQIRLPFHIQKMDTNTFDFASTLSTIKPSNASVNPSDSGIIKIKCIICWSTEEIEEICLKKRENILN